MRHLSLVVFGLSLILSGTAAAADPDPQTLVTSAVDAAGGKENLLRLFRIRERLNVSNDPDKPGNVRVSILEPPAHWWAGKRDRVTEDKEPAVFLVWAWTLGAIVDPKSELEALPEMTDGEQSLSGLRVSGTITPPMDLYFDQRDRRLVRIDWRSDIHRFSEWKEHDGARYPSKCIGYKKGTGKPWYFTEILELERLAKVPEELTR